MSLVKAVVNQVLLWGAWGAAESFGIRMLLQAAYGLPGPFRLHRPPPKSAAAITHWHVARLMVVLLYLAYCVVRSYTGLPQNLYTVLGLSPSATEHEIKQKYRYFARIYHPDKAGLEHEGLFLRLQHAYTVLSDPLLRYAYDRFGEDPDSWRRLSTMREFLIQGVRMIFALQFQFLGMQALAWLIGRGRSHAVGAGTYWGLLLQACTFAFQIQLIVSDPQPWWARIFSELTTYDIIVMISQNFAAVLLTLEQSTSSLSQLLDVGRTEYFQFGNSAKPVPSTSPEEIANVQIATLLQEEAQTLGQARRQIELLAGAVVQLEQKVQQDCALFAEKNTDSHRARNAQSQTGVSPSLVEAPAPV